MREFHDVANLFPMMSADEFAALKQDISANGQREPIWLHPDGKIIDGRNRYLACVECGVDPVFRTWDGTGSLVAFAVSLNLHRRHLTSSQKAAIALTALPMLEEEAKKRQGTRTDLRPTLGNFLPNVDSTPKKRDDGKAAAQAAAMLGTNRRYVAEAKNLQEAAPELFEKVKTGGLSITQAKREHVRQSAPAEPTLPNGRFRVLYADPPWKYSNTQPDYHGEQADHYRLMTITELCAMPIRDIAEDNAVLFLWTTSPMLEETFSVVRAWGFQYKSSFVWDKIKHNMGHYNSVRHEFLLVCVRGSCQPDVAKLFDSVQSIERTEHSRKPEEFRQIIDTIYPHGRRLELFARRPAPNWDTYGNEINE